ncbi:hypothetical protein VTL71DRAFT_11326 [Oculimacula yallundae]|uniref:Beta-lactamase-related domain-containing protein n=1 Tax=Oculimacula yallundae TaxID=86028 RepID=A0ABR4CQF3_9HELO
MDRINHQTKIKDALESILQENVNAGIPGIVASISTSKGHIWSSAAGLSSLEDSQLLDTSHLFGIGSITKLFVAVVIFQLIEEKNLNLSTKLCDIIEPDILVGIANASDATIEVLLNHTSGIESWEFVPDWIVKGRGRSVEPGKIWEKTDTLQYVRRPNPLGPKPGVWSYSNTNYTLLGLVIEKLTRSTAENEIRIRILEPLDMKSTFLEGFEKPGEGPIPDRYHWATDTFIESAGICPAFTQPRENLINATASNLSVSWTAGGILSSASDLLKFMIALRDGRLVSASSFEAMKLWQISSETTDQGLGLRRWTPSERDGAWVGHNGGVLGFSALSWWKEEGDVAVCLLSNVGTMHCGDVPANPGKILVESEFLKLAIELSQY